MLYSHQGYCIYLLSLLIRSKQVLIYGESDYEFENIREETKCHPIFLPSPTSTMHALNISAGKMRWCNMCNDFKHKSPEWFKTTYSIQTAFQYYRMQDFCIALFWHETIAKVGDTKTDNHHLNSFLEWL